MMKLHRPLTSGARGTTAVEFALVLTVALMFIFGVIEVGRTLLAFNTAAEATRLGARLATLCDPSSAAITKIKTRMVSMLPDLTTSNIAITYGPTGCSALTCETVTVNFTGNPRVPKQTFIPFIAFAPTLPAFTTTQPREFMDSASNPACN